MESTLIRYHREELAQVLEGIAAERMNAETALLLMLAWSGPAWDDELIGDAYLQLTDFAMDSEPRAASTLQDRFQRGWLAHWSRRLREN